MKHPGVVIALLAAAIVAVITLTPHAPALQDTAVFDLTVRGCFGEYRYTARGLPDGSADFDARGPTFTRHGHLTRVQWRRFFEGLQWALGELRRAPSPENTIVYAPGFLYSVKLDTAEGRWAQEVLDDPRATPLLRFLDGSAAMEPFHNPPAPSGERVEHPTPLVSP